MLGVSPSKLFLSHATTKCVLFKVFVCAPAAQRTSVCLFAFRVWTFPKLAIALVGKHCGGTPVVRSAPARDQIARRSGPGHGGGRASSSVTKVRNCTYALQCFCRPYSARGPLPAAPRQAIRRSNYFEVGRCIADRSYSRIVALMYDYDLALLADSPSDLVVLLGMVDAVASKYGLFSNAAKTEIM
eukprot:359710-Chlamydomonas_euryale.AAC.11